jgi:hypothetical protein
MYTNMDHARIKSNVMAAVNEACSYEASLTPANLRRPTTMYLTPYPDDKSTTAPFRWTKLRTTRSLTMADIEDMLTFIVDNTFLQAGDGTIRHQVIGLPMGTNASPEIANLTLYWDEAQYVDSLLISDPPAALLHAHTKRFIDDLLTWNTLPPPSTLYNLTWVETTLREKLCVFLGAQIQVHNGTLRISVFDKALEWTFGVIRYPSATSNAPGHQAAGVFTGQLTRFARLCNTPLAFQQATTSLTLIMLRRGHHPASIAKGWRSHCKHLTHRTASETNRLSHWFRRMFRWAKYHYQNPLTSPTQPPPPPPASPSPPRSPAGSPPPPSPRPTPMHLYFGPLPPPPPLPIQTLRAPPPLPPL